MKRSALGRGLSALIPEAPALRPGGVSELAVAEIAPNPLQPRRHFAREALDELAASLRQHGVLQPVVVTRAGSGGYHLITGERRWRAAQLAGLERIPAVVREVETDTDLLALALIENLQREDLTPIEEARAFHHLRTESGLSQEEIATQVGKERSTVANALRLLQLPLAVQEMVDAGTLTAGHARALAGLGDAARQEEVAGRCVAGGWSVRELESRLRPRAPKRAARPVDPDTAAAADRLSLRLGAGVAIQRRRRGGEIRIRFTSEDELIRLFKALTRESS
jgi:ParB family transcriptional regulator, chromosome partitioning protein